MKVRVVNPYKNELEEPTKIEENRFKHTHNYAETVVIQQGRQCFQIYWDEERNALKVIDVTNNGNLCIRPSSNNGILIQSV